MKGCGATPKRFLIMMLTALLFSGCTSTPAAPTIEEAVADDNQPETTWWAPELGQTWQVQYVDDLDLTMDVEIYNLDLFETSRENIQTLHSRGIKVVCYLNAGAWEDWRPDSDTFPERVLGDDYQGWPGECWLDIRQIDLLAPIMTARLDICAEKGFDGVDPDNLDGYQNATGFEITAEDQLAYNTWLAAEAHQRGLGIGLKNDPEQASALVMDFDWATTESCFFEGWCDLLTPFIEKSKPVLAIEYTENDVGLDNICSQASELSIDVILKHRQLDAWRESCP